MDSTRTTASRTHELPTWLWLWTPLVCAAVPYAVKIASEDAYLTWIRSELGFVETLTALVLALAVASGIAAWRRSRSLRDPAVAPAQEEQPFYALPSFRAWLFLLVLGCVYFLGEEISWGQHFFGWSTPETFAALNEQGETNLHNIGGWTEALLDQGPRNLLTAGAFIGGVVVPWVRARRRRRGAPEPTGWRVWLVPTMVCLPVGLLAVVSSLPGKVAELFGGEVPRGLDIKGGESKELFLGFFLFLYLASIRVRMGRPKASQS